jgi:imidazoleglycerol-phosphate dehydratase
VIAEASVVDLGPRGVMGTGICFLDHMIDQFTSHAQLGVTVRVAVGEAAGGGGGSGGGGGAATEEEPAWLPVHVDYAGNALSERPHDADIFKASGAALGSALRQLCDANAAAAVAAAASASATAAAATTTPATVGPVVFCCPLDEAFTEVTLDLAPTQACDAGSCVVALEPYGTMPPAGRTWIGAYRCAYTSHFWASLATELGCAVALRRVRGDNAHHVVESCFKAFARALRAALDQARHGGLHGCVGAAEPRGARARRLATLSALALTVDGGGASAGGETGAKRQKTAASAAAAAAAADGSEAEPPAARVGTRSRSTKETSIDVSVDLDAAPPGLRDLGADAAVGSATAGAAAEQLDQLPDTAGICTGVDLLDRLLGELRRAAAFEFSVACRGDTYIDDHHTAEDVSITLGQCLGAALGSKAGVRRMACAEGACGAARVRCVLDLSNRPHFESDLPLDEEYVGGDAAFRAAMERGGGGGAAAAAAAAGGGSGGAAVVCGRALTCEMLFHTFDSLVVESRSTAHVQLLHDGGGDGHTLDLAVAMARAIGAAFAECARVDPRRAGKVASSKGTLSL